MFPLTLPTSGFLAGVLAGIFAQKLFPTKRIFLFGFLVGVPGGIFAKQNIPAKWACRSNHIENLCANWLFFWWLERVHRHFISWYSSLALSSLPHGWTG